MPLAGVLWPAQHPHDQTSWADGATLLLQLATSVPTGQPITLLADRAFGGPGFIDKLGAHGWDSLVRAQGQTRLRQPHGTTVALRDVVTQPGRRWFGAGQAFKKPGWRPVSVVACWPAACREPVLLVRSLPAGWDLVRQYRLRSAIAALCRDGKSSGWPWEASQVRDLAHQAVLVSVLALTRLLTICVGEAAATSILRQPAHPGARRPWHARMRLFRLGGSSVGWLSGTTSIRETSLLVTSGLQRVTSEHIFCPPLNWLG